jgi:superfamily II DNA helicase RecQ
VELGRGTSPLVVILPIGGGKSLVFQLHASLPQAKTTIVVVPFRALATDLLKRCRLLGLNSVHWTSDHQQVAQITVVSADSAVSDTFLTFTSELQVQGRLDRIVIDECHVPIISGSYRQRLTNLNRLRTIPCQLVLLTGTMPPSLEGVFADTFLLGATKDGLQYIRACTDRPNIQYRVLVLSESEVERVVCELVRHTSDVASVTTGQAILFCRSRPTYERMALLLGCRLYHSTSDEKDESLAA